MDSRTDGKRVLGVLTDAEAQRDAARAVSEGRVVAHGFGNIYALTSRADADTVRAVNRLKGRPAGQTGSITVPPTGKFRPSSTGAPCRPASPRTGCSPSSICCSLWVPSASVARPHPTSQPTSRRRTGSFVRHRSSRRATAAPPTPSSPGPPPSRAIGSSSSPRPTARAGRPARTTSPRTGRPKRSRRSSPPNRPSPSCPTPTKPPHAAPSPTTPPCRRRSSPSPVAPPDIAGARTSSSNASDHYPSRTSVASRRTWGSG